MEIVALLLGMLLGCIGAVLLLQPEVIVKFLSKEDVAKKDVAGMSVPVETDRLQEQLLERGRASLERVLFEVEQDDWEFVMSKHGVRIFKKKGVKHQFKGEGVIPVPPEKVKRVLMDITLNTQYDDLCQESSVKATVNDNTKVIYLKYQAKRCLLKAARDFCVVYSHAVLNDGIFVSAGASVTHPQCPPCPNIVRGETHCSGWVVQPVDGGRYSRVTHLAEMDLHGGVPDQLVEYISKRVPVVIYHLSCFLQKTQVLSS